MIWTVPLVLQAGLMAIDEFYFHRRRGLGRWERLGHPCDTLAFLACCAVAAFLPPSAGTFYLFVAVLSCLIITKDEFIHTQLCDAREAWLHSLLFVLHPVVLYCLWHLKLDGSVAILQLQFLAVFSFFSFQVVYWNGPWLPSK
jgi:hypothetical protein